MLLDRENPIYGSENCGLHFPKDVNMALYFESHKDRVLKFCNNFGAASKKKITAESTFIYFFSLNGKKTLWLKIICGMQNVDRNPFFVSNSIMREEALLQHGRAICCKQSIYHH